mgnify:CR=1 FL=1
MKTKLFNQDKRPLKAQKISKEEIEKTRLGCASSQYYFWLQYSHYGISSSNFYKEKVYQNFLFIRLKIKDDKNVRLEVRL